MVIFYNEGYAYCVASITYKARDIGVLAPHLPQSGMARPEKDEVMCPTLGMNKSHMAWLGRGHSA